MDAEELSRHRVGVVVTRVEDPEGPLTTHLSGAGARVLFWGSIAFAPPEDPGSLQAAMERLGSYDWICFASPRAVEAVVSRLEQPPPGVRVAAVGPTTAASLRAAGWPVDRVPEDARGEGLVEAFRVAGDAAGGRVFFPASAIARDTIPRGLEGLGAEVHQVTAYRTVAIPLDREACRRDVEAGEVQVVTFTSPSALEALRKGIGDELLRRLALSVPAAAMGPTTARALEEVGWRRIEVAQVATLEGLAQAAMNAAEESLRLPISEMDPHCEPKG